MDAGAALAHGLTAGAALQVERALELLARVTPGGGEARSRPLRDALDLHAAGERDAAALAAALLRDAYAVGVVALVEVRECAGRAAADAVADAG